MLFVYRKITQLFLGLPGTLAVACFLLPGWLYSQDPGRLNDHSSYPVLAGEIVFPEVRYSGSPYLFDRFSGGYVVLLPGEKVAVDYMRYDALNDDLMWMQPGEEGLVRIDKKLIAGFGLQHPWQDSLMWFYRNAVAGVGGLSCGDCFVQVLHEGDFSLYARRRKRITSRSETITVGGQSQQVRILDDDFLYMLVTPDGQTKTMRPTRRSFINAFPGHTRDLRRVMRRYNIQVSQDKELTEAVKWLNAFIEKEPGFFE